MTNATQLVPEIKNAISKHFPNSIVNVTFKKGLANNGLIYISFTVAADKSQVVSGILENDIALHKLFVYGFSPNGDIVNSDKLSFEPAQGGTVLQNSDNRIYAYSSVKVGLRKKKGNAKQIIKHIDNYFRKLRETIQNNIDNIPNKQRELLGNTI
jgi:hypothetical protein